MTTHARCLPPPMRANMPTPCSAETAQGILANPKDWLVQVKLDGWRCLTVWSQTFGLGFRKREGAGLDGAGERLVVANDLRKATWELLSDPVCGFQSALLDGEWLGINGENQRRAEAERLYFFDLLWLNGRDLRGRPAKERFALLSERIPHEWLIPSLRANEESPEFSSLWRNCADAEGFVFKRRSSAYLAQASGECPVNPNWLKHKWR